MTSLKNAEFDVCSLSIVVLHIDFSFSFIGSCSITHTKKENIIYQQCLIKFVNGDN